MKKSIALPLTLLLPLMASCGSPSFDERKLLCDMLSKDYCIVTKASPSETESHLA